MPCNTVHAALAPLAAVYGATVSLAHSLAEGLSAWRLYEGLRAQRVSHDAAIRQALSVPISGTHEAIHPEKSSEMHEEECVASPNSPGLAIAPH
jgi:hypothetical protein